MTVRLSARRTTAGSWKAILLVANLSGRFDRKAIVREARDRPVRFDGLQPGRRLDVEGGFLKHAVSLYEELIRVPLLIVGAGDAGVHVATQAQVTDLVPTLAALMGLEVPPLEGPDLLAAFEPLPAVSETRWGLAPDGSKTDLVSLRTEGWTLIEMPAFGRFELYDPARDPCERRNRYGATGRSKAMVALLEEWKGRASKPPRALAKDPALHDKLRALGYTE